MTLQSSYLNGLLSSKTPRSNGLFSKSLGTNSVGELVVGFAAPILRFTVEVPKKSYHLITVSLQHFHSGWK